MLLRDGSAVADGSGMAEGAASEDYDTASYDQDTGQDMGGGGDDFA